jgi:Na+-driven multidrug efflux pump
MKRWPSAVAIFVTRIAWTGAILGATIPGLIGLIASIYPTLWLHIFTHDPSVLAPAMIYLRHVAPAYCILGTGSPLASRHKG